MSVFYKLNLYQIYNYRAFGNEKVQPGIYLLGGEDSKSWKKAKGWSLEDIEQNSSIEFSQKDIAKIQSNAVENENCSEYDKILLDHLLNLM